MNGDKYIQIWFYHGRIFYALADISLFDVKFKVSNGIAKAL